MSPRQKAVLLLLSGIAIVAWFVFGLPPLPGPLIRVSEGGSTQAPGDTATAVALPYLIFVLAGLGLAFYGWVLLAEERRS